MTADMLAVLLILAAGVAVLVAAAGVRTSRTQRADRSADEAFVAQLQAMNADRAGVQS